MGKGKPVYPSETLRKIPEYEYAPEFFEIGKDKTLFDGLRISDNQELCEKYQGKFPVVSVSLKGISGATYEEARRFLIKQSMKKPADYPYFQTAQSLMKQITNY